MKMTLSADGLRLLFDLTDYSPAAQMGVSLMKTFRLPDDGGTYGLPPGVVCTCQSLTVLDRT